MPKDSFTLTTIVT